MGMYDLINEYLTISIDSIIIRMKMEAVELTYSNILDYVRSHKIRRDIFSPRLAAMIRSSLKEKE